MPCAIVALMLLQPFVLETAVIQVGYSMREALLVVTTSIATAFCDHQYNIVYSILLK